jgi:hypothetical protein
VLEAGWFTQAILRTKQGQFAKVFWFFFSKKNTLSSTSITETLGINPPHAPDRDRQSA